SFKLGTVGRPFAGVELKLADDGEILVRGATCTPGYLGRPEATAELIDEDGWIHTGDVGRLDEDGFLTIVDRKKELIITAGGENIAPSMIENHLKEHPLIGQALAFGDRRPYVVALITLDGEVAPVWAAAHGIDTTDLAALAENPLVLEEIAKAVEDANTRLARVQQVKKWRLLPTEWTAESEELTPTPKLKRRVVHAKYAEAIDALYPQQGARGLRSAAEACERLVASPAFKADGPEDLGTAGSIPVRLRRAPAARSTRTGRPDRVPGPDARRAAPEAWLEVVPGAGDVPQLRGHGVG